MGLAWLAAQPWNLPSCWRSARHLDGMPTLWIAFHLAPYWCRSSVCGTPCAWVLVLTRALTGCRLVRDELPSPLRLITRLSPWSTGRRALALL